MKKIIIPSILVLAFSAFTSCTPMGPGPEIPESKSPIDTIALDSATGDISHYAETLLDTLVNIGLTFHNNDSSRRADSIKLRTVLITSMKKNTPHAFLIKCFDLIQVLGLPASDTALCKFKYVRAYLAQRRNQSQGLGMHLCLTPAVESRESSARNDTILEKTPGDTSTRYVLDLILPCPNTCDSNNSPLNNAFNRVD